MTQAARDTGPPFSQEEPMNKRLRTILNIVLILAALAGAGMLLRQQLQWRDSAASAERASEIVHAVPAHDSKPAAIPAEEPPVPGPANGSVETDPLVKELKTMDIAALRAVNPDVVGWITIPGGDISYPVLQGEDNDYYLHHTWEKKWNGGGSIFLDCRNSGDFGDFHTLVYGHRMRNGTMFAPLRRYAEQDYWAEHPDIYVTDGTQVYRYAVFAAWEPEVTSPVYARELDSEEVRREMIEACLSSSVIETGVVPGPEDRLLTLSTCTGTGHATRWVVQGKLVNTYPQEAE